MQLLRRRRFQLKIGNISARRIFLQGSKGNAQMLAPTLRGTQVHNVHRKLPRRVGSQYHFYGRRPLRLGFDILHHKAADIQGIGHGLGRTIVEIYLGAFLIVVCGGKYKPLLNRGIFLQDRIEFTVCDLNTNS
jgi:hypothetical protein